MSQMRTSATAGPSGKSLHGQWQQFGQVVMSGQFQQQSLWVANDSGRLEVRLS